MKFDLKMEKYFGLILLVLLKTTNADSGLEVMFSVYSNPPPETIEEGSIVDFDNFYINNGNIFDLSTGIFTAPINGNYEFSFTGFISQTGPGRVEVLKNEEKIHEFESNSETNIASTWIIPLQLGDTLQLRMSQGAILSKPYIHRTFNGKLLEKE